MINTVEAVIDEHGPAARARAAWRNPPRTRDHPGRASCRSSLGKRVAQRSVIGAGLEPGGWSWPATATPTRRCRLTASATSSWVPARRGAISDRKSATQHHDEREARVGQKGGDGLAGREPLARSDSHVADDPGVRRPHGPFLEPARRKLALRSQHRQGLSGRLVGRVAQQPDQVQLELTVHPLEVGRLLRGVEARQHHARRHPLSRLHLDHRDRPVEEGGDIGAAFSADDGRAGRVLVDRAEDGEERGGDADREQQPRRPGQPATLIDVSLPPARVGVLAKHGWPALHWSAIGDPRARRANAGTRSRARRECPPA